MLARIGLLAYIWPLIGYAQEVEVGLFWSREPREERVYSDQELTLSTVDTVLLLPKAHSVRIVATDSMVDVSYAGYHSRVPWVELEPMGQGLLKIDHSRTKAPRTYKGRLVVSARAATGLVNVNHTDLEEYLGGVVMSEGGGRKHLTYYEVQAIISRTYAIRHRRRHHKEGFDLCDKVHCQAFHKVNTASEVIDSAVSRTAGMILVDSLGEPLSTFFSANCGGQTSRAEWVWNESVPYCESIVDTFCIHTRQAQWTKTISLERWSYKLRTSYQITDAEARSTADFTPHGRTLFLGKPQLGIPLKEVRVLFGLKSTWFATKRVGDNVVLSGRGFGHGVGLCQEGAMRMARLGFDSKQILDFYYQNIRSVHAYELASYLHIPEFQLN